MNLNFENHDRLIRDVKEGEPKFEAGKEKISQGATLSTKFKKYAHLLSRADYYLELE